MGKNINYRSTFLNIFKNRTAAKKWLKDTIEDIKNYKLENEYASNLHTILFNEEDFNFYHNLTGKEWVDKYTTDKENVITYCQKKHKEIINNGEDFTDLEHIDYKKLMNFINYYLGDDLLNQSETYTKTTDERITDSYKNNLIEDLNKFYKSIY